MPRQIRLNAFDINGIAQLVVLRPLTAAETTAAAS
jgi:hypothetical protein